MIFSTKFRGFQLCIIATSTSLSPLASFSETRSLEFFEQPAEQYSNVKWSHKHQPVTPASIHQRQQPSAHPPWGIYSWIEELVPALGIVEQLGVRNLRLGGPWDLPETIEVMKFATRNDIEIVYTIDLRSENGKLLRRDSFDSDADMILAYKENIKRFLGEYGSEGQFFKDLGKSSPVKALMIWNEPNFHYLIPSSGDRKKDEGRREQLYLYLLIQAASLIREIDPEMKIVAFGAGGSGAGDRRFITAVHDKLSGLPAFYDVISTHPYTEGAPPEATVYRDWGKYTQTEGLHWIQDVLLRNSKLQTPVWWTELGWEIPYAKGGLHPDPEGRLREFVSPESQAAYVVRACLWALRNGVPRLYFMHLFDSDGFNGGFLVRSSLDRRLSAHAINNLNRLLPAPRVSEVIKDGDDHSYVLKLKNNLLNGHDELVYAIWTVVGTADIQIQTPFESAKIIDMIGNQKPIKTDQGKISVNAGTYPLFVKSNESKQTDK